MKNSKLKIRGLSIIRDYRYLMVIAMLGIVFTLFGLSPAITAAEALFEEQYYEAVVINIVESGQEQTDPDNWIVEQEVELRLLSGERQGETITAKNSLSGTVGMDIDLQPGDRVIVYSILQDNVIQESYIAERVRAPYIKYLVLLFVVVLVVVGGVFLIYLGIAMIRDVSTGQLKTLPGSDAQSGSVPVTMHPILAGILISLLNPFWSVWWATVGLSYLTFSLDSGPPGIVSFFSGHILSDFAWYTLIAFAVAKGQTLLSPKIYQAILISCGLFMLGLGLYFFYTGIRA
jgi:threonine/homoserine/homoserine lactone efflux protein